MRYFTEETTWVWQELSSAKDEATEARRRQLQAERSVGELLREVTRLIGCQQTAEILLR